MTFIKPLDKDIYNLSEEVNIAKNRVFGLLQEEYDGNISKVVDSLQGQSVEERVKTFDRLLERLPSIEDIKKLCRRDMDEASGERQKLEYPLGKFLREKYPEITVRDIQNSPMEQFINNEWRVELCKRYPEIEEAHKNLPRVQNPALETLLILLKLEFLRDQELAKLEPPAPAQAFDNFKKIFQLIAGKELEAKQTLQQLKSKKRIDYDNHNTYITITANKKQSYVSGLIYYFENMNIIQRVPVKGIYNKIIKCFRWENAKGEPCLYEKETLKNNRMAALIDAAYNSIVKDLQDQP